MSTSNNHNQNVIKISAVTTASALVLILLSIIPISKRAFYWNSCINNTLGWLNKNENGLSELDKQSKLSISVAVCNGAVYEPIVKSN